MPVTIKFHLDLVMRGGRNLLVVVPLLAAFALSQAEQNPPAKRIYEADRTNVAKAIAKVKSGNFGGSDVDMIERGGAVEAIPILEEQFKRIEASPSELHTGEDLIRLLDKARIATALLKLGVKDDTYWDFILKVATPALQSDAPDFMVYDAQGKSSPGPSSAFISWAKAHNVPPNGPNGTAAEDSVYIFPGEVAMLGGTGDPRAIPLLRQALSSPNHMIVSAAAEGLAELQDRQSIRLVIEACKEAPAEEASMIAESLVYFDDADAQKAVDMYVPKDKAKMLREAKAQGRKTPFKY